MPPHKLLASLALCTTFPQLAHAATGAEWSTRSIYQVMTDRFALTNGSSPDCDVSRYCGGTWAGITNKLDYIQGMGFSAIQISPVVKNINNTTQRGESYHGFWSTDWYALNEHFGTAQDLKDLAKALHERGMFFMVDIVLNDVALYFDVEVADAVEVDATTKIDYSHLNPFNDAKYFHPWCPISPTNSKTAEQDCWTSSRNVVLPDLNTESSDVQTMALTWAKELVSNYSIDGLRIHRANNIDMPFLKKFTKEVGVFTMGEIYLEDPEPLCEYLDAVDAVSNFVMYFAIMEAFATSAGERKNVTELASMVDRMGKTCGNVGMLGTFYETQDLPRFKSGEPDLHLAMNAMAFVLLADGIPTVYQNQEQHVTGNFTPYNRTPLWTQSYNTSSPLYNLTRTILTLRDHAQRRSPSYLTTPTVTLRARDPYYITRKGPAPSSTNGNSTTTDTTQLAPLKQNQTQIVAAYLNVGTGYDGMLVGVPIKEAFEVGTTVMEVLSCKEFVVDVEGVLEVVVDQNPKVFYEKEGLMGSGLCGFEKRKEETVTVGAGGTSGSGNRGANVTTEGKKEEEKKSEAMGLSVRVSFMSAALGLVGVGALVWL